MNNDAKKIVDALRCRATGSCADCGYNGDDQDCCPRMEQDAADLIERLSEELERFKRERVAAVRDLVLVDGCCDACKKKIMDVIG